MDLDELASRCRSRNARAAIEEVLRCYRVGANRAAVIGIWLALVYDIIDKLRELAAVGDKAADNYAKQFDEIQKKRDTEAALKFEREILRIAKDEFEFISAQEHVDLARLVEDRNRFGHPNLSREYEAIDATPELVRQHLRATVEHVLERPPVQGKAALESVQREIESQYFPVDVEPAERILSGTPAARAKPQLIREIFMGAISSCVRENLTTLQFKQRVAAALALQRMHPKIVGDVLGEKLDNLYRKTPDPYLPHVVYALTLMPEYRKYISDATWEKLRAFTKGAGKAHIDWIQYPAVVPELQAAVKERAQSLHRDDYVTVVQAAVGAIPQVLVDAAIAKYSQSTSFDEANAFAKQVLSGLSRFLSGRQALDLVRAGANSQVRSSFEYPRVLRDLVTAALLDKAEAWDVIKTFDSVGGLEFLDPANEAA